MLDVEVALCTEKIMKNPFRSSYVQLTLPILKDSLGILLARGCLKMKKTIISLALIGLVLGSYVSSAVAGLTYAPWVHHGDTYMATGKLAGKTQSFKIKIIRKGSRFIVRTPLGDYALAPEGGAVVFKVRIDKSWARVIWARHKATISYQNQTATAIVRQANR
jgi:hypothetical protein